ncbi:MAG TPA: L,D-transpeptidase family protein [Bacteroidales bacterium]|nr:L,D-transpeptidase family protein [Bacteroidales bacterium]
MNFLFIFLMALNVFPFPPAFKPEQLKYPRVQQAYAEKENEMIRLLDTKGIKPGTVEIFLRIFKQERKIELWARNKGDRAFIYLKDYAFCAYSGTLGPKRRQGDGQIPEGFYEVKGFNPSSNFWLSLELNYPNAADRILGDKSNLGGEIFIHGNCVTIGCIPITDDKIKELYIIAVEACNNGQLHIPVHIFPDYLTDEKLADLSSRHAAEPGLVSFWKNLKTGYDRFDQTKVLPEVSIDKNGVYHFK